MEKTTTKTRSRRGCLVCRRRKVKCDEHRPACSRCARLGLACEWRVDGNAVAAPLQRSRKSQACQRCSDRRIRCEPCESPPTQAGCRPCYYARVPCIWRGPQPGTEASCLSPSAEVDRLLDAYFEGPHHFCFYTFIHPPTFRRLHAHQRIPDALLLAVLATALRCIEPDNPLADEWACRSRKLVMEDTFSRMSALNLQAVLLLARYQWHLGAHSSASILAAVAHRIAYDLQLNREPKERRGNPPSELPELTLETRRRLMWSTFVLEDLPDAGGHQPPLRSVSVPWTITVHFPSRDFRYTGTGTRPEAEPSPQLDISSVIMPLLIIRHRVLRYSIAYHPRNEAAGDLECPWHSRSHFATLLADLDFWSSSLPAGLCFNGDNLLRNSSCLIAFLTLHCTFHVVYTDLFGIGYFLRRQMLEFKSLPTRDKNPSEKFLVYCDIERRKHASCILDILVKAQTYSQQQQDPFVAICAGVAFRILCLEPTFKNAGPSIWPSQRHIDVAFDCINSSAAWSRPIHRLVNALAQCASKQGINIKSTTPITDPRSIMVNASRPASPTMRHLGTDATIKSYLTASDRELIPPEESEVTEATSSTSPATVERSALDDTGSMQRSSPMNQTLWQTDSNELSPAALDMLDFLRTDGLDQNDSPNFFDLNMWLDIDNL